MQNRLKQIMRVSIWVLVIAFASSPVDAASVTHTVDARSGPWLQAINPLFDYGAHDNIGPTIYSAADGLNFTAGNALTIEYLSGLTSSFGGVPPTVDADGYVNGVFKNSQGGSSGNGFPSKWMVNNPPDIWLNTLVGTFADVLGVIVGTPFPVFDGPTTVIVPFGATQLQLGVNDDIYGFVMGPTGAPIPDNTGSLEIQVSDTPEPATMGLFAVGVACLAGYGWRRKQGAKAAR